MSFRTCLRVESQRVIRELTDTWHCFSTTRIQNVEIPSNQITRDLVATCTKSLGYEKFLLEMFRIYRWNDGYRSHEKYSRYDMRYIIDRWNLDISSSRREKEMVTNAHV